MTASRAVSTRAVRRPAGGSAPLSARERSALSGSPLAAFPRWVWSHDMLSCLAWPAQRTPSEGGHKMPTYIMLAQFTQQGITKIRIPRSGQKISS
jgi:hypothetical protein